VEGPDNTITMTIDEHGKVNVVTKAKTNLSLRLSNYPKLNEWTGSIENNIILSDIENIIGTWNDDLLKRLNDIPTNNPNFFKQVETNPEILRYFEEGSHIIKNKASNLKAVELDMYAVDRARLPDERIIDFDGNYKINTTRKKMSDFIQQDKSGNIIDDLGNRVPKSEETTFLSNKEFSERLIYHEGTDRIKLLNGNNLTTPSNQEGLMYIIDELNNIWIGGRGGVNSFPHPTLVGGYNPNVKCAGMIHFKNGKIYRIDNNSGHFKPLKGMFDDAIKIFEDKLPKECFDNEFKAISLF